MRGEVYFEAEIVTSRNLHARDRQEGKAFEELRLGYGKLCFRRPGAVKLLHNHVAAASLGLAIRDCKERGFDRLTYAPDKIGKLHTF